MPRYGRCRRRGNRSRKWAAERPEFVRAFVAIEVGESTGPGTPNERETPPTHLTLRFLGEVPDDLAEPIARALRAAVAEVSPFAVTFDGLGAFPSRNTPHVVWVGATLGRERVRDLARRVSDALVPVGFPAEPHEFVPHVTLFRVRSTNDRRQARRLLEGKEPAPAPRTVRVTEITLKESTRTREGPVHRTRGRFPLGGRPDPVDQPVAVPAESAVNFLQR